MEERPDKGNYFSVVLDTDGKAQCKGKCFKNCTLAL